MKLIIITAFLVGITNCDKLDNRYLPPHNAQSSSGSQFVHPPTVADLRTTNPNGLSPQRSDQHSTPTSQYPPKSGSSSINRQYLSPNGPTGQYSAPTSQYSPPASQYSTPTGQYTPKGEIFSPKGQHLSQNGQFGQHSTPTGQYSAPTSQYSPKSERPSINRRYLSPNSAPTSQYSSPKGQYSPKGEITSINRQYNNAPSGQYSPSSGLTHGQSSGNVQISQPNRHYLSPNALFSGASQTFTPQEQGHQFNYQNQLTATNEHAIVAHQNYQPTGFGQDAVHSPGSTSPIAILRSSGTHNAGDGSYQYSYETENGIAAEEEGSVINNAGAAKGGYSYTSPEGENIAVEYVADENGFQPKGAHLPQIPEAILKSIELNKAAIARGEVQEGQYETRSGYQYHPNVGASAGGFKVPQGGAKQSFSGDRYSQESYRGQEGYRY